MVLSEFPMKPMTVRAIEGQLQERGWIDPMLKQPRNTVLEAAKRLIDDNSEPDFHRVPGEPAQFVYVPSSSNASAGDASEEVEEMGP